MAGMGSELWSYGASFSALGDARYAGVFNG